MHKQLSVFALIVSILSLTACGGGGGGGYSAPSGGGGGGGGGGIVGVGPLTIGLALPSGTIGIENDPTFGTVGGYTQTVYSQTLGFAPGTNVTIKNLSSTTAHTLNVLSTTAFPAAGTAISSTAAGGSTLASGFATGSIAPGGSVGPITLSAGTYYLGCAFHYTSDTMRTALVVSSSAAPGPQATPQPSGGSSGCVGSYC